MGFGEKGKSRPNEKNCFSGPLSSVSNTPPDLYKKNVASFILFKCQNQVSTFLCLK